MRSQGSPLQHDTFRAHWNLPPPYAASAHTGLVNSATSYAVNRHIETEKGVKTKESIKEAKITHADFERALRDITPAFGVSDTAFEGFPTDDLVMYSDRVQVRRFSPRCRR